MTRATIDLVRSIVEPWEQGDFRSAEWANPDIELVIADGPAPGSWKGPEGLVQGLRGIMDTWREFRVEEQKLHELDAERVLLLAQVGGVGKTSGLNVDRIYSKGAGVFTVRDGGVSGLVLYWKQERALADLDLSEPP